METNHLSDLILDSPPIDHSTIISIFVGHHAARAALQLPYAPFPELFSLVSSHPEDSTEKLQKDEQQSMSLTKMDSQSCGVRISMQQATITQAESVHWQDGESFNATIDNLENT